VSQVVNRGLHRWGHTAGVTPLGSGLVSCMAIGEAAFRFDRRGQDVLPVLKWLTPQLQGRARNKT